MICPYCQKKFDYYEKTEYMSDIGVIKFFNCPRCHLFVKSEYPKLRKRKWWSVKELIENGRFDYLSTKK